MSFEEILRNLQRDYLASLPQKISDLEGMIQNGEPSVLREAFHKLKGTGRTYGIPEISDLAEIVENICLSKPGHAGSAARQAVMILHDISMARNSNSQFDLESDPRYKKIRVLSN